MEDKQNASKEQPEVKPVVKVSKKSTVLWPLIATILLATGVGVYYWKDNQAKTQKKSDAKTISSLNDKIASLEKQITESKNQSNNLACTAPTASAKENIIASITSKNTAALEGYMADSVKVVIAASEASFDRTPTKAIEDIKYVINATEPWNFALNTATLNTFKAGFYKDYFKDNSIVGVAADKKVIVFNFNCSGKINGVFMAASSDLLSE